MRLKALSLSLMTGLSFVSVAAFAEPAIQPGETLESLSKVKITTTVNGQPGSINELVASGQVKLISDSAAPAQQTVDTNTAAQSEMAQPLEQPPQAQLEQPSQVQNGVDPSVQSQMIDPATPTQASDQSLDSQNTAPADMGSSSLEAPVNGATMSESSAIEQPDVQSETLPQAQ
jgi:hypothetical protein